VLTGNLSPQGLGLGHHHGVVEVRGTDLVGDSILLLLLVLPWHRLNQLALCLAHQIVGLLLLLRDLLRHKFLKWLSHVLH
jgi:hypothetical protein